MFFWINLSCKAAQNVTEHWLFRKCEIPLRKFSISFKPSTYLKSTELGLNLFMEKAFSWWSFWKNLNVFLRLYPYKVCILWKELCKVCEDRGTSHLFPKWSLKTLALMVLVLSFLTSTWVLERFPKSIGFWDKTEISCFKNQFVRHKPCRFRISIKTACKRCITRKSLYEIRFFANFRARIPSRIFD